MLHAALAEIETEQVAVSLALITQMRVIVSACQCVEMLEVLIGDLLRLCRPRIPMLAVIAATAFSDLAESWLPLAENGQLSAPVAELFEIWFATYQAQDVECEPDLDGGMEAPLIGAIGHSIRMLGLGIVGDRIDQLLDTLWRNTASYFLGVSGSIALKDSPLIRSIAVLMEIASCPHPEISQPTISKLLEFASHSLDADSEARQGLTWMVLERLFALNLVPADSEFREPLLNRALEMIDASPTHLAVYAAGFLDAAAKTFTPDQGFAVFGRLIRRLRQLTAPRQRELAEGLVWSICRLGAANRDGPIVWDMSLWEVLPHLPLRTSISANIDVLQSLPSWLLNQARSHEELQDEANRQCLRLLAWLFSRSARDLHELQRTAGPEGWLGLCYIACGLLDSLRQDVPNSDEIISEALHGEEFRIAQLEENAASRLGMGESYNNPTLPVVTLEDGAWLDLSLFPGRF
jgi:hypothetical protein